MENENDTGKVFEIELAKYGKHYSENKLMNKLKRYAKVAGIKVVYMVLLLYYVLESPDTPKSVKVKIYGAIGYFILPLDLVPDAIPGLGYADDYAALFWAIHSVYTNITPAVKDRANAKLHEWFGDYDKDELNGVV